MNVDDAELRFVLKNVELLNQVIQRAITEYGIFVLGNPFVGALSTQIFNQIKNMVDGKSIYFDGEQNDIQ